MRFRSRAGEHKTMLASLIAGIALMGWSGSAIGAETHVFDATLSLTGNCATSAVDPVPDPPNPGCPEAPHPPSGSFVSPRAIATDSYGNIYVANYGPDGANGEAGRIDIFDSEGLFITEILNPSGPKSLAIDSEGHLYVFGHRGGKGAKLQRYTPTLYKPADGEIKYEEPPAVITEEINGFFMGLAINPLNDHLFAHFGLWITEFSSATEENKVIDSSIGSSTLFDQGLGLAIDGAGGRIYASDLDEGESVVQVFDLAAPHTLLDTIDGSGVPGGKFFSFPSLAVEERTGHLFVFTAEESTASVYEFTETGELVSTIQHGFQAVYGGQITVDNGDNSPNGDLEPEGSYLFVPSHPNGLGHVFAFGPKPPIGPPVVESVSFGEVSQAEAELLATINPENLETTYAVEYTTKQKFDEEGYAGSVVAGEGKLAQTNVGADVSAFAEGLSPGTAYRFRVVATNSEGSDELEGEFTTYPVYPLPLCPNDDLRIGFSALLPDCRAYELVSPANTNGRAPIGVGHLGIYFPSRQASPAGDKVSFLTEGGALPGTEGTGSFAGDPYLATRGPSGWSTASAGPSGVEAEALRSGSTSPDQGYSFWQAEGGGTAVIEGESVAYVRYPDGHSEFVGRGTLDVDLQAEGRMISENGSHIIFASGEASGASGVRLEEDAPGGGTDVIYDRTADEVTHVVSLLPGDVTPAVGQNATYLGASLDGEGVAFEIGKKLYLRYDNEETFEIGENVTFAGVVEGGGRIFYVKGGNLFAFDVATESVIPFSSSGNVTVVNVSADGTAAYLVSQSVLTVAPNPLGATAKVGQENLYLSVEGAFSFVGAVTKRDVEGQSNGNETIEGLGLWALAQLTRRPGKDPSRTTPDGKVLLFESRAPLTGYDPEGHAQIYRYDSEDDELACLSCLPTGAPATGKASLQSIKAGQAFEEPFSSVAIVNNLRSDGRRAIFQSTEALAVNDTDGLQDVYEWEDQGVGTCAGSGGCVYLISSGRSSRVDYLYAVSDSGDDVFFRTSDLLLPSDTDETPSIYDARVGGGFAEPVQEKACGDESCHPPIALPPVLPTSRTPVLAPKPRPPIVRCPKGKRKVKRHGKVRCVKKHKHRRHKAGSDKKGASK